MKPDYKNWMPKGMVLGTACGAVIALALYIVFGIAPVLQAGTLKTVLGIVFLVLTAYTEKRRYIRYSRHHVQSQIRRYAGVCKEA